MEIYATARDLHNGNRSYRLVREDDFYYVQEHERGPNATVFNLRHVYIPDCHDETVAFVQAMTEWVDYISEVVADLKFPRKIPDSFSLEMYTAEPTTRPDSNVYIAKGEDPTACLEVIARCVDTFNIWDFDALMELGLPASVHALGDPPEGAETVWVVLTIN